MQEGQRQDANAAQTLRAKAMMKKGKSSRKAQLGTGKRFKQVAASARASGARNPNAVAAVMGRKAHGSKKMAQWAAAGRRRAARRR